MSARERKPEFGAEALARAAQAGVHAISLPTPFTVGRVNSYLIDDEPLTLFDVGPRSAETLKELEAGIEAHGHRLADVELIVLSHQHIDHFGLAAEVQRRSGAQIAALDILAPYLEDFEQAIRLDLDFSADLMRRHGYPEETIATAHAVAGIFNSWAHSVEVHRPLVAGSTIELRDRRLEVLHRPGHSASDTVLHDAERRLALVADHLIRHISSNPLISRPLPGQDMRDSRHPHALLSYKQSLRATREMALDVVLSGHGEPITDHVALIDERIAGYQRRAAKIRTQLEGGERTAYEVATELWGNIAVTEAFATLSSVLGHVDLLLRDGLAHELERDGRVTFSA